MAAAKPVYRASNVTENVRKLFLVCENYKNETERLHKLQKIKRKMLEGMAEKENGFNFQLCLIYPCMHAW